MLVQIRDYYEDKTSHELRPGKRGISLSPLEWQNLCSLENEIDSAVSANMEFLSAQNLPKVMNSSSLSTKLILGVSSIHFVQSSEEADVGEVFSLGDLRKVSVREYRDVIYVDIREFYLEGDQERPGKKGISLTVPQWKKLSEVKDQLLEDTEFPLGDLRRVSNSSYKGFAPCDKNYLPNFCGCR